MTKPRRWIAPLVMVAVVLLAGWVLSVITGGPDNDLPLDPSSRQGAGTKALVDIMRELGADVAVSTRTPRPGDEVALVLLDTLTEAEWDETEEWVRAGGRLVTTDPTSPLAPPLVGTTTFGLIDATVPRRCEVAALADVNRVATGDSLTFDVPQGATGCFLRGESAWLVIEAVGEGVVVSLGGPGFLTNSAIREADNALLAASLLAPEPDTTVLVIRPPLPGAPGQGDQSLVDLIPPAVDMALLQLLVAFAAVVLWRMRRLGRPVQETQEVTLAGSELVVAVGELLQQSHARSRAAQLMADDLRRDLANRLGVPSNQSDVDLADAAAARTGVPTNEVLAVLRAPSPASERELVALAAAAEELRRRVLAQSLRA